MNETNYNIFLQELNDVIEESFKVSNSGGEIVLTETEDSLGNCKNVTISTDKKIFALNLDIKDKSPFNIFNKSKKDYTNKNDCIIYCHNNEKLLVLLIELKSLNSGKYLKQIKASKNFSTYLISQINLFSTLDINEDDIQYRGILFKTGSRSPIRGTTKKDKLIFNNRGDLYCTTLSCNKKHFLQSIRSSINNIKD